MQVGRVNGTSVTLIFPIETPVLFHKFSPKLWILTTLRKSMSLVCPYLAYEVIDT